MEGTKTRMNPQIQQLIALQETDQEIADLKRHLEAVPKQIETSRLHLAREKKALDDLQEEIQEARKKRNQLEQQTLTEKDHMAKVRIKLPNVKTNKEYSAILVEVDAIKNTIASLEDQELEVMETLEEKEKEIPGLQEAHKKEEQRFQDFKKQKENECAQMKKDLQALDAKRREIIGRLDKQWATHYEKIARTRDEHAVVPLEGSCCGGCNQQVLPQLAIDIKIGEKVLQCNACYRFLYWVPASETQTVAPE
ncbi:MAG: zinc ribbon domain-containing protein [Nitrospinales bacterium]